MTLVDYSSDDDSANDTERPTSVTIVGVGNGPSVSSSLPPLPASFHDLYASTVRTSIRDDPALHHGRSRQMPHVVGNWPSHIYIEWFPSQAQCDLLSSLVSALWPDAEAGAELHSFLTSDLNTPLPLHISLSRPFVLTTAQKDSFLARLPGTLRLRSLSRSHVRPSALSWHRSPDSNRAFLVLRVQQQQARDDANQNLTRLLERCNELVREFGQPELYSDGGKLLDRFHVSVAWAFVHVTESLQSRAASVYESFQAQVAAMEIPIDSIKVKIGNAITSLPLVDYGHEQPETGSLF